MIFKAIGLLNNETLISRNNMLCTLRRRTLATAATWWMKTPWFFCPAVAKK